MQALMVWMVSSLWLQLNLKSFAAVKGTGKKLQVLSPISFITIGMGRTPKSITLLYACNTNEKEPKGPYRSTFLGKKLYSFEVHDNHFHLSLGFSK